MHHPLWVVVVVVVVRRFGLLREGLPLQERPLKNRGGGVQLARLALHYVYVYVYVCVYIYIYIYKCIRAFDDRAFRNKATKLSVSLHGCC